MTVRPDELLDQGELAELLGVSPSSLRSMRAQPERHRRIDGLPAPIRNIGTAPVWDREQVEAWAAMKRQMTPSTAGVGDSRGGLRPSRRSS